MHFLLNSKEYPVVERQLKDNIEQHSNVCKTLSETAQYNNIVTRHH